jgi:hypothetical protein
MSFFLLHHDKCFGTGNTAFQLHKFSPNCQEIFADVSRKKTLLESWVDGFCCDDDCS